MLVLSRKAGERLIIDDKITVVVNRISANRVSLAIEAPADVPIMRGELQQVRDDFEPQGLMGRSTPLAFEAEFDNDAEHALRLAR